MPDGYRSGARAGGMRTTFVRFAKAEIPTSTTSALSAGAATGSPLVLCENDSSRCGRSAGGHAGRSAGGSPAFGAGIDVNAREAERGPAGEAARAPHAE